jgi:hypothetical protein
MGAGGDAGETAVPARKSICRRAVRKLGRDASASTVPRIVRKIAYRWVSANARRGRRGLAPEAAVRQALAMDSLAQPFAFFLLLFSGWVNRQQQDVIEYLREENRVLRAAHGSRRIRLNDAAPPARRER